MGRWYITGTKKHEKNINVIRHGGNDSHGKRTDVQDNARC